MSTEGKPPQQRKPLPAEFERDEVVRGPMQMVARRRRIIDKDGCAWEETTIYKQFDPAQAAEDVEEMLAFSAEAAERFINENPLLRLLSELFQNR